MPHLARELHFRRRSVRCCPDLIDCDGWCAADGLGEDERSTAMENACSAIVDTSAQLGAEAGIASTTLTRVTIVPVPISELSVVRHGCRYDVYLDDSELLLSKVDEPVYSVCRLLAGRGVRGRLEVWRPGKRHADMIVPDLTKAAAWTIEETAKIGPRLRKHRPMTATAFSNRPAMAARSAAWSREEVGSSAP